MHCSVLFFPPALLSPQAWLWVPSSSLTGTIAKLANTTNDYRICSEQLHILKQHAHCKGKKQRASPCITPEVERAHSMKEFKGI